jgi:hypothetical protein
VKAFLFYVLQWFTKFNSTWHLGAHQRVPADPDQIEKTQFRNSRSVSVRHGSHDFFGTGMMPEICPFTLPLSSRMAMCSSTSNESGKTSRQNPA